VQRNKKKLFRKDIFLENEKYRYISMDQVNGNFNNFPDDKSFVTQLIFLPFYKDPSQFIRRPSSFIRRPLPFIRHSSSFFISKQKKSFASLKNG